MTFETNVRLAVIGAGLIGSRHAEAAMLTQGVTLASIADPSAAGKSVAEGYGVDHYTSLQELIAEDKPDGIVLATPNQLHVENTLECIEAGLPTLIEKPLAVSLDGARKIVDAGKAAGVPLLTGHHRRHNPLIARAKSIIEEGQLGEITAVQGTTWFFKPDDYFNVDWRRRRGAGPVYLNLIHDIDMLRHLCGEVTEVHAMESNAVRGNEVEETAVILLRFENGTLGTVNVSDTVVAPWSWELTARENPVYPATSELCYQIGGTKGSLSLPNLALWSHPEKQSWFEPISATKVTFDFEDPLTRQLRQFAAVIRGTEAPLVSAAEGLKNQQVIEAVKRSAASGDTVFLAD
ncbi:MAG: Gfo/Idh/MocA family oxidoreductase [Granulosicoccus sp.]|nr:Gfo/Idh/MocA family oxidoreductase [Granulosicoccus sp.]